MYVAKVCMYFHQHLPNHDTTMIPHFEKTISLKVKIENDSTQGYINSANIIKLIFNANTIIKSPRA